MSEKEQLSIHPRNWKSIGTGKTKNTCAPRNNAKKGKLAKHSAKLLARRNDHSATLKSLPSGTNSLAFKTPGSMNARA